MKLINWKFKKLLFILSFIAVFQMLSNIAYADVSGGGMLVGAAVLFLALPVILIAAVCFIIIMLIKKKKNDL